MLIGVPKEIKPQENRVGLIPSSVRELVRHGHQVIIEQNAGSGIDIKDEHYQAVGAEIVAKAQDVYGRAEMVVKVKEPQALECHMLRPNQTLFMYLHLAPDVEQTAMLLASGCIGIAYETVTDHDGGLPLLSPMSEVAGRMSIQAGAWCLEKPYGGRGILLGGVPGVAAANVVVIGGGVVGTNAIRMAMGMEAHVTVLDNSLKRLKELDFQFGHMLTTIYATLDALEYYTTHADLVVGAVLIPGATAPKVVTRDVIKKMVPGSVLVDVSIDQGGCFESSRPTTHLEPTYIEDGVVHYCVTNMPGAVPRTSTFALNNATLPFILQLANKGSEQVMRENHHLRDGLNVYKGMLTYEAVAKYQHRVYVPAEQAIG